MDAAAPAIPVNPSNPATNAIIKNVTAHLNMKKFKTTVPEFNWGFA